MNKKGMRLLVELEIMGIMGYDISEEDKNYLTDKVMERVGADLSDPKAVIEEVGKLEHEIKNGFKEPLETPTNNSQKELVLELARKQLAYIIFEQGNASFEEVQLYAELDKLRNTGKLHTFKGC